MLGTAVEPELRLPGFLDAGAAADAGETVLHAVPEIIIDDPQLGDVLDDPFVLRINPGQPLSRTRLLDIALLVPDQPANVEFVVQDARAPQGMTADRRV